jgi:predicted lipid-binding transport protein (Tim44 family)
MLAARRRLLGMLTLLETAAIALAVLGFAALWVLIPPSIMLIGYMLLLREAAHADAERAHREEEAARARARAQERARERAAQRAAARAAAAPAAPAAAAPPAPAARYEDASPGRDFAPGLAGKYTTSNEDYRDEYDEYTAQGLRAVGD